MRALVSTLAILACGCTPVAVALSDSGTDASDARVDAHGPDAGFDPSSLAPCTLTRAPTTLELSPLLAPDPPDARGRLEQRAFYVLLVLRADDAVRAALDADTTLTALAAEREAALRDAASTCEVDASCLRASVAIDDAEAAVDATLAALETASITPSVATVLRASHLFERFAALDDAALVRTALGDAIIQLHAALDRYGVGELGGAGLADVVADVASEPAGSLTWWEPLARTTIAATLADGRDEAVRYEPLDEGENAAALAAISSIDWSVFPFAALLVPGQGPTDPDTALHPNSAQRADLAADRYRAGLAPLVVLSGGHVHPDRTRFSEAIEMKRYLMETRGLPESAILVDPYARHTTTNLRDVTRVLLRAGVAPDARILVVTDVLQTIYIRAAGFEDRCDEELHFQPFGALEALSPTDTCMTMSELSLTADAADLLDP